MSHERSRVLDVAKMTFSTSREKSDPLLSTFLQVNSQEFGIWCGVSIHETAQVIAAAFQGGEISGEFGTIAKLSRVIFLAPIVLTLEFVSPSSKDSSTGTKSKQLPIPWFVFGFIALMLLNSGNVFPEGFKKSVTEVNHFLLTISMAGMGLKTSIREIRHKLRGCADEPLERIGNALKMLAQKATQ